MFFLKEVELDINRRPFLTDNSLIDVRVNYSDILIGNSSSIVSHRDCLLSAIGELFEREMLLYSKIDEVNSKKKVWAYSFAKECIKKEDMYQFYTHKCYNDFDSTGLATHVISKLSIKNSFEEYVERQSYIFSYLSKTSGIKIIMNNYPNYNRFKFMFKNCNYEFYNISLTNQMYVIVGLALKNDELYIGINCSSNIDNAIEGCIREMIQCKWGYELKKSQDYNQKTKFKINDYGEIYFNLSGKKLWEAYSYLRDNDKEHNYLELKNNEFDIRKISKQLNIKYKMNPLLGFLANRNIGNEKYFITRIIDKQWFNSIEVSKYSEKKLKNIEKITGKKLDRKCNFLPFP